MSGTSLQAWTDQSAVRHRFQSQVKIIASYGWTRHNRWARPSASGRLDIAAGTGALPKVMTLDAGYWSEDNAKACADQGIDVYIATGRLPHGQPLPTKRGPLAKDADVKTRMARKLRSKKGSRIYAQRKAIVEPVNGQIKEARGLRRFLLRGLEKLNGEWHLIAATHNLLKLIRFQRSQ